MTTPSVNAQDVLDAMERGEINLCRIARTEHGKWEWYQLAGNDHGASWKRADSFIDAVCKVWKKPTSSAA